MEEELKVGDKVEAKGIKLEMTIKKINGEDAECFWPVDKTVHFGTFPLSLLEKHVPAAKGIRKMSYKSSYYHGT